MITIDVRSRRRLVREHVLTDIAATVKDVVLYLASRNHMGTTDERGYGVFVMTGTKRRIGPEERQ